MRRGGQVAGPSRAGLIEVDGAALRELAVRAWLSSGWAQLNLCSLRTPQNNP